MGKLKSEDSKTILYPSKLDHPEILIQFFCRKFFEEDEDHALIISKLSKQEENYLLYFSKKL